MCLRHQSKQVFLGAFASETTTSSTLSSVSTTQCPCTHTGYSTATMGKPDIALATLLWRTSLSGTKHSIMVKQSDRSAHDSQTCSLRRNDSKSSPTQQAKSSTFAWNPHVFIIIQTCRHWFKRSLSIEMNCNRWQRLWHT